MTQSGCSSVLRALTASVAVLAVDSVAPASACDAALNSTPTGTYPCWYLPGMDYKDFRDNPDGAVNFSVAVSQAI